jgi:hypothetical protein
MCSTGDAGDVIHVRLGACRVGISTSFTGQRSESAGREQKKCCGFGVTVWTTMGPSLVCESERSNEYCGSSTFFEFVVASVAPQPCMPIRRLPLLYDASGGHLFLCHLLPAHLFTPPPAPCCSLCITCTTKPDLSPPPADGSLPQPLHSSPSHGTSHLVAQPRLPHPRYRHLRRADKGFAHGARPDPPPHHFQRARQHVARCRPQGPIPPLLGPVIPGSGLHGDAQFFLLRTWHNRRMRSH